MKHHLALLIFPASGSVLLAMALALAWSPLTADRSKITQGRVEAMLVSRGTSKELLTNLATNIEFKLLDGSSYLTSYSSGVPTARESTPATGVLDPVVSKRLAELSDLAQISSVGEIQWMLQRDTRQPGPDRIVAVNKVETALLYDDLKDLSHNFNEYGIPLDIHNIPLVPVAVKTTAEIGWESPDARKPSLLSFEALRHGEVIELEKRDFLTHREPWSTEFRPVVRIPASEKKLSRWVVSDLGRHGRPAAGFNFFGPASVTLIEASPLVDPVPQSIGPALSAVQWFSRLCEAFFARWAYPLMLAMTGFALWGAAGILISLAANPSRCPDESYRPTSH